MRADAAWHPEVAAGALLRLVTTETADSAVIAAAWRNLAGAVGADAAGIHLYTVACNRGLDGDDVVDIAVQAAVWHG